MRISYDLFRRCDMADGWGIAVLTLDDASHCSICFARIRWATTCAPRSRVCVLAKCVSDKETATGSSAGGLDRAFPRPNLSATREFRIMADKSSTRKRKLIAPDLQLPHKLD